MAEQKSERGAPCKQHACFLEFCVASMVEAHNGLGAIVKLHERLGSNLLHQVCICMSNTTVCCTRTV